MILTSSHPERWLYAGVLQRAPWTSDPLDVRCWDGQVRRLERGGVLLTIRTAVTVVVVGPEERAGVDSERVGPSTNPGAIA